MDEHSRHILEAITLLKENGKIKGIPKWYRWLDRFLALCLYLAMGYIYITFIIWLRTGK